MRIATIAAFVVSGMTCSAVAGVLDVDLDRPGPMETLQRDRPEHHEKILDAIAQAQVIHVDPRPSLEHAATLAGDPRRKADALLLPSNPAKKRIVVPIDDVAYRVTVRMTKHPARLEKAR